MTYDPIDTNDDGVVDADVDNQSVSTGRATIGPEGRGWGDTIHLFAVGGQSNAEGKGDLGGGNQVDVEAETALQYNAGDDTITEPLADPFSDEDFGSAWPAFAQRYHQLTGVKSAYINSAVRGASQTAAADSGFGNWSSSGSLRSDLVSDVDSAIAKLESLGYDVEFKGILWSQGETDADAIDNATITQADYGNEFADMVDYFGGEFPDAGVVWVFQTGLPDGGTTTGYNAVREEQLAQIKTKTRARLASDIQQRFPFDGKMRTGEVHYDQTGLNEMGIFGAETIVGGFSPGAGRYEALARWTGTKTIPSQTFSTVEFDEEEIDKFGQFDTGTRSYTAPADGLYWISARVTLNNTFPTDTRFRINIRKNASTVLESQFGVSASISDYQGEEVVAESAELRAGDTVIIQFRQQDGSGQKIYGDSTNSKFHVEWKAPLPA